MVFDTLPSHVDDVFMTTILTLATDETAAMAMDLKLPELADYSRD